jgi:hypothetical protein
MRDEIKNHIDNITDCFSCADGGVKFITLLNCIDGLDKQAQNGNKASGKIIDMFTKFSKLINILTGDE